MIKKVAKSKAEFLCDQPDVYHFETRLLDFFSQKGSSLLWGQVPVSDYEQWLNVTFLKLLIFHKSVCR